MEPKDTKVAELTMFGILLAKLEGQNPQAGEINSIYLQLISILTKPQRVVAIYTYPPTPQLCILQGSADSSTTQLDSYNLEINEPIKLEGNSYVFPFEGVYICYDRNSEDLAIIRDPDSEENLILDAEEIAHAIEEATDPED